MKKQMFVRKEQIMKMKQIRPALSISLGGSVGRRKGTLTHEHQEEGEAGVEGWYRLACWISRISH